MVVRKQHSSVRIVGVAEICRTSSVKHPTASIRCITNLKFKYAFTTWLIWSPNIIDWRQKISHLMAKLPNKKKISHIRETVQYYLCEMKFMKSWTFQAIHELFMNWTWIVHCLSSRTFRNELSSRCVHEKFMNRWRISHSY